LLKFLDIVDYCFDSFISICLFYYLIILNNFIFSFIDITLLYYYTETMTFRVGGLEIYIKFLTERRLIYVQCNGLIEKFIYFFS